MENNLSEKLRCKVDCCVDFVILRERLYKLYNACKADRGYPEEDAEVWDVIEKIEDLMKYFVSELN